MRKSSLTFILIAPFVIQLLLAVSLAGYVSFRYGKQTVADLVSQIQTELASRVAGELMHYLGMPHILNQLNAEAIWGSHASVTELERLRPDLLKRLKAFPGVMTCGLGLETGEFLAVGRRLEGGFDSAIFERRVSEAYRHYLIDDQGTTTDLLTSVSGYDVRSRSWYASAVEAEAAAWSPIYVWASRNNIGLSAVLPVYDAAGMLMGVQLSALSLEHISEFLGSLQIGKTGQVFIMEPSGLLVATSLKDPVVQPLPDGSGLARIHAAESASPLVRTASAYLVSEFGDLNQAVDRYEVNIEIEGQKTFLRMTRFVEQHGLEWFVVFIVPEVDVMTHVNANMRTTVLLTLAALSIAIGVGITTAQWIVRPIQQMNASARSLAQGNWDQHVVIDRRDEVGELASSFNEMARQLQEAFTTLEQRVEERTTELATANERLRQEEEALRRNEEELRQNEMRYKKAQAIGHVGNWEYDLNTTHFWGSEEARRLYGFSSQADDSSTEEVENCIPERERVHQALVDLIEHETPYDLEFEIHPKGSHESLILSSKAELLRDEHGNPQKVVGVIQDITARKKAETALKTYSLHLEDMVEERAKELRDIQQQLVRREKLATLGQMAGSIGHELRTPLATISNAAYYLNMVLSQADEAPRQGAAMREYLDIVATEVRNAEKIITDLLDFARIKALNKQRVHVGDIVEQVLAKYAPPDRVQVTTDIPSDIPAVLVDPAHLEQVLHNLILNAYQAMPQGGALSVSCKQSSVISGESSEGLLKTEHGSLTTEHGLLITVSDTGCGIPEEHLDTIFEPLFTTKPKGIGLGLAVCKNLVEANGGHIEFVSKEREGTTFTLFFPGK